MQNKLHHKFHTKLISYDQFMEYKLYDLNEGYYSEKNQEFAKHSAAVLYVPPCQERAHNTYRNTSNA